MTCDWGLQDADSATWATGCGGLFTLIIGTPSENRLTFCCYCGERLREVDQDGEEKAA